jgi:REP element-mobilizing transposase RayT
MSTGYQINDQTGLYFLTFQIVDWVDLFTRRIYKEIAIESFEYCIKNKGLELYAFVIMSNHIHLIASTADEQRLSDIIRDFKKFTARRFIQEIDSVIESRKDWILKRFEYAARSHSRNSEYQVWTHENHAIELNSPEFIEQKLNYIHQNPVRAGIVELAEDYIYSSASNYAGKQSVIDIKYL